MESGVAGNIVVMKFTKNEVIALAHMWLIMALADGRIAEEEKTSLAVELFKLGVQGNEAESILESSKNIDHSLAVSFLSNMTTEKKKEACAFLGTVIASDGDIDQTEVKVWSAISLLCGFPSMSIDEAVKYWASI